MIQKKLFIFCLVIVLLLALPGCNSSKKQTTEPPTESEKVLTGNVFIDAETGTHITKTETGTVASRYTKINFETAKNASMEDFVDFAFNEVKKYEQTSNWYTLEFLNDKGGSNGKGICFFGCNPYTVQYGNITTNDGSLYEILGNLIYNKETSSYEYEALEAAE